MYCRVGGVRAVFEDATVPRTAWSTVPKQAQVNEEARLLSMPAPQLKKLKPPPYQEALLFETVRDLPPPYVAHVPRGHEWPTPWPLDASKMVVPTFDSDLQQSQSKYCEDLLCKLQVASNKAQEPKCQAQDVRTLSFVISKDDEDVGSKVEDKEEKEPKRKMSKAAMRRMRARRQKVQEEVLA